MTEETHEKKLIREAHEWAVSVKPEVELKPFPEEGDKVWKLPIQDKYRILIERCTNFNRLSRKGLDIFIEKYGEVFWEREIRTIVEDALRPIVFGLLEAALK
jgi:hypothetical protein